MAVNRSLIQDKIVDRVRYRVLDLLHFSAVDVREKEKMKQSFYFNFAIY